MYKKVSLLTIVLIWILIIGNGCGNTTGEQSCQYQLELNLDKATTSADFQAVIDLADGDCSSKITTSDKAMIKAAAYLGKAGISIASLAHDLLSGSDPMTLISSKLSGSESMKNISSAIEQYKIIIGSSNCSSSSLAEPIKSACSSYSFTTPLMAVSTVSVLAGGSVIYNGQTVTAISALLDPSSVGISKGTATKFDVDGDEVFDNAQASGMALSYVTNGTTTFENSSIISLGNVTFTSPTAGTFESVKSTIYSISITYDNKINYHLVDNTGNFTITTSGYCTTAGVDCQTPNGTTCLPCPVVDSSGSTITSTEGVLDSLNSSNDESLSSVSDMLDCNKDSTVEGSELAHWMANRNCGGF